MGVSTVTAVLVVITVLAEATVKVNVAICPHCVTKVGLKRALLNKYILMTTHMMDGDGRQWLSHKCEKSTITFCLI